VGRDQIGVDEDLVSDLKRVEQVLPAGEHRVRHPDLLRRGYPTEVPQHLEVDQFLARRRGEVALRHCVDSEAHLPANGVDDRGKNLGRCCDVEDLLGAVVLRPCLLRRCSYESEASQGGPCQPNELAPAVGGLVPKLTLHRPVDRVENICHSSPYTTLFPMLHSGRTATKPRLPRPAPFRPRRRSGLAGD